MAKKNNLQKMLVEKCEKIAVGVAAGVALLLIITQLFWPGQGFFAPNPKIKFQEPLEKLSKQVSARLVDPTYEPGPEDKPDPTKKDPKSLGSFATAKIDNPGDYRIDELFAVATPADMNRRQPAVLPLAEGKGAFARVQLRSYILSPGLDEITVLKGAGTGGTNDLGSAQSLYNPGKGGRPGGAMGGVGGRPKGLGAGGNFQAPDTGGLAEGNKVTTEVIKVEKLGTDNTLRLAETVRPLRLVVVAASFPYRAQLDEFRTKLRLTSRSAVLSEVSRDVDLQTNQYLPAFRFLGVKAQRLEVDPDGQPIKGKDWEDVELREDYKKYIVLSGKRYEPEDPALELISFDRLVMPRLRQMREGQYPHVEKDLPLLASALDALKEKKVQAAPPSFLNTDDFDPFSRATTTPGGPGEEMGRPGTGGIRPPMTGGFKPPMTGGKPPFGSPPGQPGMYGQPQQEVQPPEHCLVRIVDVKVQPGKAYKYRLQVQMANPNYHLENVASPKYSESKELPPSPWFELKDVVVVPPDMHYYAVDQKDLDGKETNGRDKYKGPNADLRPTANQVVLQIHRWLEKLDTSSRKNIFVGEWVVGERLVAGRGEYVGEHRPMNIEVPIWVETAENFIIPKKKDGRSTTTGMPVSFSTAPPQDAVLVDFTGTEARYDPPESKGSRSNLVRDVQRNEVLLCTGDGRLLALDGAADVEDPTRTKRLEEYRDRVEKVKKGAGGGMNPMGPGGGPFSGP